MNVRNEVEDLVSSHGPELVARAIGYLPRIIALLKAGRDRRIDIALDTAHARIDAREEALVEQHRAARRDEPTVPHRINDTGTADS